jgi:COP9 signalosome complex subunit 1
MTDFDLELHVLNRYTGEARLQRLLWIALHSSTEDLQQAAYMACLSSTKQQNNTARYKEIYHHHHAHGFALPPYDAAWVQEAEAHNRHERETLLVRLQTAQAHLNKEAVRAAFTSLSTFYLQTGDLHEAFHAAVRAKDYCTSRQQTASNSLQILAVAIHMRNYAAVQDYVPRLEHTVGSLNISTTTTTSGGAAVDAANAAVKHKVLTASALERLAAGDYAAAATKFRTVALSMSSSESATTTTTTEDKDWDSTVLAPDDLALYAAVLTLAVEEDRCTALQLADHPEALERVPILRDVLSAFYKRASYHQTWQLLESNVWPILEYDIVFQHQNSATGTTHLQVVQECIRHKAIGFYWKAYHNCPLSVMATELGPGIAGSADELKTTVLQLLKNRRYAGKNMVLSMDTRLDGRTNTLVRSVPDLEQDRLQVTTQKLQATSTRVLDDTYSMVVRLACLEHDLVVADPLKQRRSSRNEWNNPSQPRSASQQAAVESSDDDADFLDGHMGEAAVVDEMNPEDLY